MATTYGGGTASGPYAPGPDQATITRYDLQLIGAIKSFLPSGLGTLSPDTEDVGIPGLLTLTSPSGSKTALVVGVVPGGFVGGCDPDYLRLNPAVFEGCAHSTLPGGVSLWTAHQSYPGGGKENYVQAGDGTTIMLMSFTARTSAETANGGADKQVFATPPVTLDVLRRIVSDSAARKALESAGKTLLPATPYPNSNTYTTTGR